MILSATRIAAIRAKTPSDARIARYLDQAGGIRSLAIELAHADHIAWAEAQQTRMTWNSTPVRRGRKGIVPFAECLTPEQAELAGRGIEREAHTQRRTQQNIDFQRRCEEESLIERASRQAGVFNHIAAE
ncbi:hypothetical protein [Sphingomonas oryzagri]|uniref:Integrase n=1 Tax=Sphingomonas oryzagri TaxID=3042314 RepID=A0ABT6N2A6_9SPHN|nr:hypothetical protein [Sphingomonas oryzagri]MDH7638928.1 hypothetical protein [Sphingomonas oryzagri]